ncbi:MAG TPA: response regulator [Puia sp.]|jgi:CheY-like chemotaxis protein|nr:response regulator [Puia sp.]
MQPGRIDIILVEDNPEDADLTIRSLRKNGIHHSLLHLKDGEEALDFIFCTGAHSLRVFGDFPKLILLDLKMPKVDGIEVLRQLKSDHRTKVIPVVLLTSSNQEKDILDSYRLGVNSYLVKPVEFEAFAKAVSDISTYWLHLNQLPY